MKVLLVNGSPHAQGCTHTALCEVANELEQNDIETEIVQTGTKPVQDCIACGGCKGKGCCVFEDGVNEFLEKAAQADGFVFGTPVYYAHPSGRLLSFLDRAFYAGGRRVFEGKPGAAVASARRGGTTATLDAVNKYFSFAGMPMAGSTYWNMVHGTAAEQVAQDEEGLQTMRNLGRSLAWMVKAFAAARDQGIKQPTPETTLKTNFVR